ncbi:MAG: ATP-binding protein [Proteobacteria bacterium]|nr:ATP-binding protein [Pseudomonadota bacterium]
MIRFSLRLKLTLGLVLSTLLPVILAVWLIDQMGKTAANVGASDAAARIAAMEKSIGAYHELVDTTKRLHAEVAQRLAQRPDLVALDPTAKLHELVDHEPGLRAIALVRADGTIVAEASRPLPGPAWRDKIVDQPLPVGALRLSFIVSATLPEDLQELKTAIDASRTVSQINTALPASYFRTFLVLLGIPVLLVGGFSLWYSTRITQRIGALVETARAVARGKHDARVQLVGNDETALLGDAFDTMLDTLEETRQQVAYLQRMGVWQDVARRLAHEIKNPLTPIQLAVQQCVSAYRGAATDVAKFTRLLGDTGEIVEEEIASLRRLVDTFRTLGALPKVEKAPIELADAIEELKLDPLVAARLRLVPPARPVTVRADKLLLKRVLANLIENGIHAGQEAGTVGDVVVTWEPDRADDSVHIFVDDAGKGVADSSREKIFEPYVTTKETGTGLGLAIARKIAIEHGGDLVLAPERAPTGGARFVVSLPLRGPEASLS